MDKLAKLKKYVQLFRRNIERYLAPDVSLETNIYPVDGPGAVFEFIFNREGNVTEKIQPVSQSIGHVLSIVPQRLVSNNIKSVIFGGTNIYMEGNRLLVIKGEDEPEQWNGTAVQEDVRRVVSTSQGGK